MDLAFQIGHICLQIVVDNGELVHIFLRHKALALHGLKVLQRTRRVGQGGLQGRDIFAQNHAEVIGLSHLLAHINRGLLVGDVRHVAQNGGGQKGHDVGAVEHQLVHRQVGHGIVPRAKLQFVNHPVLVDVKELCRQLNVVRVVAAHVHGRQAQGDVLDQDFFGGLLF